MKNEKFKSSYKYTKELYAEFNKGLRWRERLYYLIMIVLIILTVLSIGFIFFLDYHFVGYMAIILIFMSIICVLLDRSSLNYKRMVESHNRKEVCLDIVLTDDCILGIDGKNQSEYSYDSIKRIVETNNLIILVLKYRLGITIDKRNLTGGSLSDLKKFLSKKCLKVKKIEQAQKYDKQYFELTLIIGIVFFIIAQIFYINDYKELTKIKDYLIVNYSLNDKDFYFTHDEATLEMDVENDHYLAYFYRAREKDFYSMYKKYSLDDNLEKFSKNCNESSKIIQCKFEDSDDTYYAMTYKDNFIRIVVSSEEVWTWLIVNPAVFGE